MSYYSLRTQEMSARLKSTSSSTDDPTHNHNEQAGEHPLPKMGFETAGAQWECGMGGWEGFPAPSRHGWSPLQHLHSPAWLQPTFSLVPKAPGVLPAFWTACSLAGCRTSWCANCSCSTGQVCQEAWLSVGLSQAAPVHTCRCLEKENSGYLIAGAGAGLPADSQVSAATASSRFTGAALVVQGAGTVHWTALQALGQAGWAALNCSWVGAKWKGNRFHVQNTLQLSGHCPSWCTLSSQPRHRQFKHKKEGRKHSLRCSHCGGVSGPNHWVMFMAKRKTTFPILMGNALAPAVLYSVPRHWFTYSQLP